MTSFENKTASRETDTIQSIIKLTKAKLLFSSNSEEEYTNQKNCSLLEG